MSCPLFRIIAGLYVYCNNTTVFLNSTGLPDHKYLDPQSFIHVQDFQIEFPLYPILNEHKIFFKR